MDITFDCGAEARNVGVVALAAGAHVGQCADEACQADVKDAAKAYSGAVL